MDNVTQRSICNAHHLPCNELSTWNAKCCPNSIETFRTVLIPSRQNWNRPDSIETVLTILKLSGQCWRTGRPRKNFLSECFSRTYLNTNLGKFWAFWTILGILGYYGQFWAFLGSSGQFWAILAILGNSGHILKESFFWDALVVQTIVKLSR